MYSSKSCKSWFVIVLLVVGTASYAAFRPHHTSVPLLGVANTALLGISTPMVTCPHAPDIAHEPPLTPTTHLTRGKTTTMPSLPNYRTKMTGPCLKAFPLNCAAQRAVPRMPQRHSACTALICFPVTNCTHLDRSMSCLASDIAGFLTTFRMEKRRTSRKGQAYHGFGARTVHA